MAARKAKRKPAVKRKKAPPRKAIKRTVKRRNSFTAIEVMYAYPGSGFKSAGRFPAKNQDQAKRMAEAEFKREGKYKSGMKFIAGAVPLASSAAREGRRNGKTIIRARKVVVKNRSKKRAVKRKRNPLFRVEALGGGNQTKEFRTLTRGRAEKKMRAYVKRGTHYRYKVEKLANGRFAKVDQIRETFSGRRPAKTNNLNAPDGTPASLAKLGRVVSITVKKAGQKAKKFFFDKHRRGGKRNPELDLILVSDAKGKMHLATAAPKIVEGPAQNLGEVIRIDYQEAKPHLGYSNTETFYHHMGEEGGRRPTLYCDGKGGLKFIGGDYKITREGIRN